MSQEDILTIVSQFPGITQSEVAQKYGHNSSMFKAVLRDKLITRVKCGQTFKLYPVVKS